VAKLPDKYILAELQAESYLVSAAMPKFVSGEQFRTDAKCTDHKVVLGGCEVGTGRWFQVVITKLDVFICLLRERVLNGPPHQQSFLRPWLHWWLLVGRNSAECENPWSFVLLQVLITGAMSFFLGTHDNEVAPDACEPSAIVSPCQGAALSQVAVAAPGAQYYCRWHHQFRFYTG